MVTVKDVTVATGVLGDADLPATMDEQTFHACYRRTAGPLRAYVVRVMGSVSHADDIVQEAYLRLLRAPATDDPAALRALLIRIASHLMIDHWRRARRRRVMWEPSLDPDTEAEIASWMQTLAREALDQPPRFTAAEIWQKAELLRRWDAQRKATAPIDIGERVEVGIGLAGALVLLVWLLRQLPQDAASSTLSALMIATVLLLVSAAAFSVWGLVSGD